MGNRKIYVFGVAFLACFVGTLVLWPTSRPVYESRAIVSIQRDDGESLRSDELASRLRAASREALATDTLEELCNRVSTPMNPSELLRSGNAAHLRSAIQVGIGAGKSKSEHLISLTLKGNGTSDEVEFLNSLADVLVSELRSRELSEQKVDGADEIQSQFRISQARVQGMRNAANLITTQQSEKLAVIRQIDLETGRTGIQQIPNPARQAYLDRLRSLTGELADNRRLGAGKSSFDLLLARNRIDEEIRTLKSQLARESGEIEFEVEEIELAAAIEFEENGDTRSLPVVRSDYISDQPDGVAVRRNEFFAAQNESGPPAPRSSRVKLVDHQQAASTQQTLSEIDAEIQTQESKQNRLQATLVNDISRSQRTESAELVRLYRPAFKSQPTEAGVTKKQFGSMLTISLLFGLGIAIASRPEVKGGVFHSPEEVSRKLGIAVVGIVPVGKAGGADAKNSADSQRNEIVVQRIVLGCEVMLIVFAVVMLATTVIHSDIAVAIRENPLAGVMEAVRTIRPW